MNAEAPTGLRRSSRLNDTRINLSHGSGGKAMRTLTEDVFVTAFDNPLLGALEDLGVAIVTGDTKVVERGAADKLFINTAGIGVVPRGVSFSAKQARPGDVVIVNGVLGDHGAAILIARNQLALEADITSDCQPLDGLVAAMLACLPSGA